MEIERISIVAIVICPCWIVSVLKKERMKTNPPPPTIGWGGFIGGRDEIL